MITTQAVILAAGKSSRFFPYNSQLKALYPIMGRPVISHTINSLLKAGFKDIIIVGSSDLQAKLEPFLPEHLKPTFFVQSEPLGQGNALLTAKDELQDSFLVINCEKLTIHQQINDFPTSLPDNFLGATLRIKTDTPEKYGIYDLEGDQVKDLIEKPNKESAPSNWKLVGVYLLTKQFIELLESTPEEHYQLESAIKKAAEEQNFYAYQTALDITLKYPWDVLTLNQYLLSTVTPHVSDQATIASTAVIEGDVVVEAGATIHNFATILGPAYIGKDAIVGSYCQIRNGTILEDNTEIQRYADIRNTHFHSHSSIHSGFIGDSIIGSQTKLAAGFITANVRLDHAPIRITINDQSIDTKLAHLGAFIGPEVNAGIRVSTMPGTIIGPQATIGPGVHLKSIIPANSTITSSNL